MKVIETFIVHMLSLFVEKIKKMASHKAFAKCLYAFDFHVSQVIAPLLSAQLFIAIVTSYI